MKLQVPKPYLKCNLRFDWHIPTDETSIEVIEELLKVLVNSGFKRQNKKAANVLLQKPENIKEKGCMSLNTKNNDMCETSCGPVTAQANNQPEKDDVNFTKFKVATIGLRSVLRAMHRDLFHKIFLDASVINPSAVGTALGLYALNCRKTKVYVLKHLDEQLSKGLNIPSVTAVGINSTDEGLCVLIDKLLAPVEQKAEEEKVKNKVLDPVVPIISLGKNKSRRQRRSAIATKKKL